MKILRPKPLYLPALLIVTVIMLLAVFIGMSTHRNLNRDKERAFNFLEKQALSIIRSLEMQAKIIMLQQNSTKETLANLVNEAAEDQDVAYIGLGKKKNVIFLSPKLIDNKIYHPWIPELSSTDFIKKRMYTLENGMKIYEVARNFQPFLWTDENPKNNCNTQSQTITNKDAITDLVIVIGMHMAPYESARSSDLHHAVIMLTILIALGAGVFFFIFVIQNYYLVGRTLRQTQDYTKQVVANMANGLLSINADGKLVSYNQIALELLDINEENISKLDLKTVLNYQEIGIDETLSLSKAVMDREVQMNNRSGEIIPIALSVTPIPDEKGNKNGAVIVIRDLREIKRLEKEVRHSEKMAAVGKIAAGIAHEIRNPLSSIRGFANFLGHKLKDQPKEREYADIMVREIDRINSVVSDLLTFSKPMQPDLIKTEIIELITHTTRLIEHDAKNRDIQIHIDVRPGIPDCYLDMNLITQAVLNLLLNAIDAIEKDGEIIISAEMDKKGKQVELRIEDNGRGIPSEVKDIIFEPYFTQKDKGTGLGLSIVSKIIKNHNGEIIVESPPKGKIQGCSFILKLPIEPNK